MALHSALAVTDDGDEVDVATAMATVREVMERGDYVKLRSAAACGLGEPLVVLAAASERFDVVHELLAVECSGLESALPAEYV